jgi:penicillin V acylase-like amidase (Ntn superfamily)
MAIHAVAPQGSERVYLTMDDQSEVIINQVVITPDSIFGQRLTPGNQSTPARFARRDVRAVRADKPDKKKTVTAIVTVALLVWAGYMYSSFRTLED